MVSTVVVKQAVGRVVFLQLVIDEITTYKIIIKNTENEKSLFALNIKLGTKRLIQIALVAVALFYAYKMIRK